MSLPSGYKEVEYIQSSGTQYINTGFIPKYDSRIVLDAEVTSSIACALFGARGAASGTNPSANALFSLSGGTIRSDYYGSMVSSTTTVSGRTIFDKNKNVVSFGSNTITNNSSTASSNQTLFLFAVQTAGSATLLATMKLYACQIYDNGTLVRDFYPCTNESGAVGLYDLVGKQFYSNAGTGAFVAGAEVKGSHKTLIDGTWYDLKSGKCLVGGTAYSVKKGRVLMNGTGYDIPFSSGIPIGTLQVGSVVKIGVNGKSYDFLVVNQGVPSNSSRYDSSCNGTWLLMKDIYENRVWNRSYANKYESSDIHAYLNNTFLNLFDSNIKDAIKQVKIPYRKNGGSGGTNQSGANGLPAKIFLLSCYEVGWTTIDNEYFPLDGAKLSYFESGTGTSANNKRIAKLNGSATFWWLRSMRTRDTIEALPVSYNGGCDTVISVNGSNGIRPAFILPGTFPVIQNPDGSYSPAT